MLNVCPQNNQILDSSLYYTPNSNESPHNETSICLLLPCYKFGVILFSRWFATHCYIQSVSKNLLPVKLKCAHCHKNQPDGLRDIEMDVISLFIVPEVVKERILQEWCSHLQYWFAKNSVKLSYHIHFNISKPIQLVFMRLEGSEYALIF